MAIFIYDFEKTFIMNKEIPNSRTTRQPEYLNTNLRNKKALPVEYSVLVVYDLSSSLTAYTSRVTKTYLDET